jgi:hypothetical protein
VNSGFEPRELAVTSRCAINLSTHPPDTQKKDFFLNVLSVYKKVEKSIGYILQPQPQCFYNNMSNLAESDGLGKAGLCNLLAQIISICLNKISREIFM